MALKIYTEGAADGNFGTAGNWDAGVPANGDSWIIDTGTINITAGLDQSAKTFGTCIVGPNYKGQLGNQASDCFKCGAALFSIAGGATKHFIDTGAATIAELRLVRRDAEVTAKGNITKAVVRLGKLIPYSGTWSEAHLVTDAGAIAATLEMLDADIADVWAINGIGKILATSVSGRIRKLHNISSTFNILAGQLDEAYIGGGYVTYDSLTAISGKVLLHGGVFGLTNVRAQTVARVDLFPNAVFNYNQGAENDVITTFNRYDTSVVI